MLLSRPPNGLRFSGRVGAGCENFPRLQEALLGTEENGLWVLRPIGVYRVAAEACATTSAEANAIES